MPELPEVETIKNDLAKVVLNKKISKIIVNDKKIIKSSINYFAGILKNNSFKEINRAGKLLIFQMSDKKNYLIIHLKMTGQLIYLPRYDYQVIKGKGMEGLVAGGHSLDKEAKIPGIGDKLPNKYTRVIFEFKDEARLFFNDLRKFGYLKVVGGNELKKIVSEFGPEPLSIDFKINEFRDILVNKKTSIKALLLNQKIIAGIGNIYADEILFKAGIKPGRKVNSLKMKEIESIFKSIKTVLKKAIKYRGTTFSNFVDTRGRRGEFIKKLKVYKREGEKCLRCRDGVITKIKIAGRGTRFCKSCQT